ncbi:MAG: polymer-forming cytoskeletal protein [Polyangiaceae bacterium]
MSIPTTTDRGVSMLVDAAQGRFTFPNDGRPVVLPEPPDPPDPPDPPGDGPDLGSVGLMALQGPLNLADRVYVQGAVVNAGSSGAQTDIGVDARVGNVFSIPSVNLRGRNDTSIHTVNGFVVTGGAVYQQNNADITDTAHTVQGRNPDLSAVLKALSFVVTFPTATSAARTIGMGQTVTLPHDGTLVGDVDVHGTLVLTSGDYYLTSLTVQSQGTLTVNATSGKVRVFIRDSFTLRGTLGPSNLVASNVEFIVEGSSAMIDAPGGFHGIIVARHAALVMHQITELSGAFFGLTVETAPDQRYTLVPWAGLTETVTVSLLSRSAVFETITESIALQADTSIPTTSPANVTTWRLPTGVALEAVVAFAGGGNLNVGASSTLGLGGYGTIVNTGSGTTTLGAGARVGEVYSVGNVTITAGAEIEGDVHSNGTITVAPGAVVHGQLHQNEGFTLQTVSLAPPAAGTAGANHTVAAGSRLALTAGNYGAVTVAEGGILELSGNAFQFTSLSVAAGGTLLAAVPDNGATIRVAGALALEGSLGAISGNLSELVLFALGEDNIELSGTFHGQLVAPNARVIAGGDGQRGYLGRIIASELYLLNGVQVSIPPEDPVVHLYHFGFAAEVGAGTVGWRPAVQGSVVVAGGGALPSSYPTSTLEFHDSRTYTVTLPGDAASAVTAATWQSVLGSRPYVLVSGSGANLPSFAPRSTGGATLTLDGVWLGSANAVDGRVVILGGDSTGSAYDWDEIHLTQATLDPGGTRADGDPIAPIVLVIRGVVRRLVIERSIIGAIIVDPTVATARVEQIVITDSIVDGTGNVVHEAGSDLDGRRVAISAPLAQVELRGVTLLGDLLADCLEATNSIIAGALYVANAQNSCLRYSAASLGEPKAGARSLPKLFQVPKLDHVTDSYFSSLRYGDPTYCQLSLVAPAALQEGAEGGTEMGVFSYLNRPIRVSSVLTKIR